MPVTVLAQQLRPQSMSYLATMRFLGQDNLSLEYGHTEAGPASPAVQPVFYTPSLNSSCLYILLLPFRISTSLQ